MDEDKLSAYQTLYTCLESVAILSAPIAPFFMERLFLDLNSVTGARSDSSVHLVLMPQSDKSLIDNSLEDRMELAQRASSLILALRRKVSIKVRQPLAKIMIPVLDDRIREQFELVKSLVLGEVNVKDVEYILNTKGLITKRIKPNFKVLGKKYGKQMKEISNAFTNFTQEQISEIEERGRYTLALESGDVVITTEDAEISSEDMPGWLVASEGKLTVALDVTITDSLRREGVARELVNRIQNLRKDSKFEVTDKIEIVLERRDEIEDAMNYYKDYICTQTLAAEILLSDSVDGGADIEWDDTFLKIKISRI
jgi:isoleucyl-tRNA synthetase